jgi:hypothetical protein
MKSQEGTVLLIPLRGGHGVGVVSRVQQGPGANGIWCYFYVFPRRPTLAELAALRPEEAALHALTGELGLKKGGTWQILGHLPSWDRTRWPMLERVRAGTTAVRYDDHDPTVEISTRPVSAEEAQTMPRDGSAGHLLVEKRLQRALDDRHPAPAAAPAA